MPEWTSRVTLPDGRPAILEHQAAAENTAARQLADTGLSSLQSNSAWRFLLNLKSREPVTRPPRDRWFPDPGRVPVDAVLAPVPRRNGRPARRPRLARHRR